MFVQKLAVIGWWSDHPNPRKEDVQWYSEAVPPELLPCLYLTGSGTRGYCGASSLAVETLASHVLIVLRTAAQKSAAPPAVVAQMPSITDSQGNGYVLAKLYARTQPAAAILWCLARTIDHHQLQPSVRWTQREHNTWPDQLTHLDAVDFNEAHRHHPPRSLFKRMQEAWASMTGAPIYPTERPPDAHRPTGAPPPGNPAQDGLSVLMRFLHSRSLWRRRPDAVVSQG